MQSKRGKVAIYWSKWGNTELLILESNSFTNPPNIAVPYKKGKNKLNYLIQRILNSVSIINFTVYFDVSESYKLLY